jgi:hypothetical protein
MVAAYSTIRCSKAHLDVLSQEIARRGPIGLVEKASPEIGRPDSVGLRDDHGLAAVLLIDDNPDAEGQEKRHQTQHATDHRTCHGGLSRSRIPALEPKAEAKSDLGGYESHNDRHQIHHPKWRLIKEYHFRAPFILSRSKSADCHSTATGRSSAPCG